MLCSYDRKTEYKGNALFLRVIGSFHINFQIYVRGNGKERYVSWTPTKHDIVLIVWPSGVDIG